jgi:NADP-dependent 3-hydroxy acid dehydrogenase YdfG
MTSDIAARPVVVITGASAGVGRAVARRFAASGAWLGLIARDEAALRDTAAEVESLGGRAISLPTDVSDAKAVFAAADAVAERFGRIDIWINNAMATVFSPVADITPEEFRRVTDVTYLGFVHGTMAALRHMRPRDRGTILQVGSALAYRGIPLQAAYCGAKHAVRGFTDSLRTELLHDRSGIRLVMTQLPAVNTTQFGWARTHMAHEPRPVPPVVAPEAIAEAIWRAADGRRREVWIGASTLKVIVGPGSSTAISPATPTTASRRRRRWHPAARTICSRHSPAATAPAGPSRPRRPATRRPSRKRRRGPRPRPPLCRSRSSAAQ